MILGILFVGYCNEASSAQQADLAVSRVGFFLFLGLFKTRVNDAARRIATVFGKLKRLVRCVTRKKGKDPSQRLNPHGVFAEVSFLSPRYAAVRLGSVKPVFSRESSTPSPYHRPTWAAAPSDFMLKSEGAAAQVERWYGEGRAQIRRIRHLIRFVRGGTSENSNSRWAYSNSGAVRPKSPCACLISTAMKSEWYFFSVRNEMKPARSKKKDSWESCPRAFSPYSQVDSGWWI